MALLLILLWIFLCAGLMSVGLVCCNVLSFIFGIFLFFGPILAGDYICIKTPKGQEKKRKEKERQLKIEKEFGIIEYWENKK